MLFCSFCYYVHLCVKIWKTMLVQAVESCAKCNWLVMLSLYSVMQCLTPNIIFCQALFSGFSSQIMFPWLYLVPGTTGTKKLGLFLSNYSTMPAYRKFSSCMYSSNICVQHPQKFQGFNYLTNRKFNQKFQFLIPILPGLTFGSLLIFVQWTPVKYHASKFWVALDNSVVMILVAIVDHNRGLPELIHVKYTC